MLCSACIWWSKIFSNELLAFWGDILKLALDRNWTVKPTKPNLPNQAFQTKPTKPNLPNQTYQTKPTKSNLPNQTYQTKPTKSNLPNQTYQIKTTKPNITTQAYQTKPTKLNKHGFVSSWFSVYVSIRFVIYLTHIYHLLSMWRVFAWYDF